MVTDDTHACHDNIWGALQRRLTSACVRINLPVNRDRDPSQHTLKTNDLSSDLHLLVKYWEVSSAISIHPSEHCTEMKAHITLQGGDVTVEPSWQFNCQQFFLFWRTLLVTWQSWQNQGEVDFLFFWPLFSFPRMSFYSSSSRSRGLPKFPVFHDLTRQGVLRRRQNLTRVPRMREWQPSSNHGYSTLEINPREVLRLIYPLYLHTALVPMLAYKVAYKLYWKNV